MVSSSNGRWYDYDDNGNMLSDGVRSFEYDIENRPVAISYEGSVTEFVYDGNGNRIKKSGPQGDAIYIDKLYEINGASTAKYIFSGSKRLAMVNQTDTYYYHQDHLGGTSIVTDGNGNKVEQVFYKPFGEVIEDTGSVSLNHKYTGQELDPETDLYFYNARYYNPSIGRFISADTIIPHFDNPQSFNRYSYVLNNPLKFNDPTGHYDDQDNNGDTEAFGKGKVEDNPEDVGISSTVENLVGSGRFSLAGNQIDQFNQQMQNVIDSFAEESPGESSDNKSKVRDIVGKIFQGLFLAYPKVKKGLKKGIVKAWDNGGWLGKIGFSIAGISVAAPAAVSASIAAYSSSVFGGVASSIGAGVLGNPQAVQNAIDFGVSAVTPGPPEPSPGGYFGGVVGQLIDWD